MSSILYTIEQMARRDTDIQRVRSIMKAGALMLTRAGIPTKVLFGKKKSAAGSSKRAASSGAAVRTKGKPSGKAMSGKRSGKQLKRRSDGVAYSEGMLSDVELPTVLDYAQDVRDVRDEGLISDVRDESYIAGDVR